MSHTGWGLVVAAAVLLLASVVTGMQELTVMAAGCVLAVATAWLWVRRRPSVTVERLVEPSRVSQGEVALARVVVHNTSKRALVGMTFEERVGHESRSLSITRIPAGRSKSATYRLPTARRAAIPLGPGAIRQSDPFGVLHATVAVGAAKLFLVHPRRHELTSFPRAARRALDGPEAQQLALGSMTFHTLRDYVPGDDLRHVHWKSSAKTGTLMVRQFVDTSLPELTIVLDVSSEAYRDDDFDGACEATASVIGAFHGAGYMVRLVTTNGVMLSGCPDANLLYDELAKLDLDPGADLNRTLDLVANDRSGIGVAVITGVATDLAARFAARLGSRHRTVVLAEIRSDARAVASKTRGGVQRIQAADGADFARAWDRSVRW